MNFIFECWKYLSWVSKAHSALEDKIRIPKQPCNILYLDHIKYSCSSFQWCMHAWCFSPKLIPKLNIVVRICLQDMWPHTAQSKSINASVLYRLKIKIRELCRPYLTFYPPLDIYSNNIVTIRVIHSHWPLSLRKMIILVFFLTEERKAFPLTTDSSFVHEQISIFIAHT